MPSPVVTQTLKTLKLAPKSEPPVAKAPPSKDSDFDAELEKAKPKPAAKSGSSAKPDGKRKSKIVTRKSRAADGSTTEQTERVESAPVGQPKLTQAVKEAEADLGETAQTSATEQPSTEAKQSEQAVLLNPLLAVPEAAVLKKSGSLQLADADSSAGPHRLARVAPQVANANQLNNAETAENDAAQNEERQTENRGEPQQQSAEELAAPTSFKRLPGSIQPAALGETAPPLTDQAKTEVSKSPITSMDVTAQTSQELIDVSEDLRADAPQQTGAAVNVRHDSDVQETVVSAFAQKLDAATPRVEHAPAPAPAPPPAPDAQFAADNHPRIISGIRGQPIPGGGTMHIRLDPPELGALQVTVRMEDGVMSAMFQTSTDDATRLLSHSLSQLKHVLETQGVSVEKLHVQQSPRDERQSFNDAHQQRHSEHPSAQHEQQRREMLRRMWRRLTDGSDPLDMVA